MRKRREEPQEKHDWVIEKTVEKLYADLKKKGRKIYKNPNQQKNFEVDGFYPDIVVYNPETKKVTLIDEIETEVGDTEKNQWEDFAKLGKAFSLTVPKEQVPNSKSIIKKSKLSIYSLWSYVTDYPKSKNITYKKESLT